MARYKVHFSAAVEDASGITARCAAYLMAQDTMTLANLHTALQTWLGEIAGLTAGKIVWARAHIEYP